MRAMDPRWRALGERLVAGYRASLGDDFVALAAFGSVARGTAGPHSDLDLYVVTRVPGGLFDLRLDWYRRVSEMSEYRRLVTDGYWPEPRAIYHTVEQLKSHPWILLDISHHGVILYDPSGVLDTELASVRQRLRALGAKRIERPDGTWMWDLKPDWKPGDVIEL